MWFITVMEKLEPNEYSFADTGCQRTWGYFNSKAMAVAALHSNCTDMWETIYNYAVLEEIGLGIANICEDRQWFKFDYKRNGYFEIEEPECVKHLCNFALG